MFPDEPIELIGFRRQVFESKQPLLVNRDVQGHAEAAGQPYVLSGEPTKSALFVPLLTGGTVHGVISLQNVDREDAFTDADVRLLTTLAGSLSVALENVRLFDETKRLLGETEQRNAELGVVNEIGTALAKQLDFNAIIDAVGDRVRSIFEVQTGFVALFDPETETISTPYSIDQGQRSSWPDRALGPGLVSHVIRTRQSLRLGSSDDSEAHGALIFGTSDAESWLGVPILAGDRVLGVIALERIPKNAFSESDERLLSTMASSMGVALENARLFDETKRLLNESNERAAELAIINSVQQGLAAELAMQAMYDLVGDKIAEIFDAQVVDIGVLERSTG